MNALISHKNRSMEWATGAAKIRLRIYWKNAEYAPPEKPRKHGNRRLVPLSGFKMVYAYVADKADVNQKQATILLVCPYNLFRQALAMLLEQSMKVSIVQSGTVAEADKLFFSDAAVDLVLLCTCDQGLDEATLIARLCSENPQTNIVVVSPQFDAALMTDYLNAGVDGYLTADMSIDGLIHSLRLVAAGEKVFPSQLATDLTEGTIEVINRETNSGNDLLSPREQEIINCLVNGDSNKVIANNFRITEATVKMHLRQIFSKIGVNNRTQAAAWALNNQLAAG